jgi:thiamine biosynthesis protein ThiI
MPEKPEYDGIVIHFGELWLKGRNRHDFINALMRNIRLALPGEYADRLEKMRDRLMLNVRSSEDVGACMDALSNIFGISWFAPFRKSGTDMDSMISMANSFFSNGENVKIEPHRSYKMGQMTSKDIVSNFIKRQAELKFVPEKLGDKKLYIDVLEDFCIVHSKKRIGLGGLPVGTSGKAVVLLSGGIDSPVAAYYALKRGLEPVYLHFYAYGTIEEFYGTKMPKILNSLLKYYPRARVYAVPVHLFQISAMKEQQKYEVVLFKKFIYETAHIISERENAKVIVTGESLGQVSSQTAENLAATSQGIRCLIFRPLLGFDKQEIITKSKELGMYDISIMPYKDACSLRSRNPVTRISPSALESIYSRAGMEQIPRQSIEKASVGFWNGKSIERGPSQ